MPLTIDGSDPTGDLGDLLDAKLNIAGGKILQIVRATDSAGVNRSTNSATFVDVTNSSVTITPQKSDSSIIVIATFVSYAERATSGILTADYALTDSSNNFLSGGRMQKGPVYAVTGGTLDPGIIIGYSTPATTSATTYKLRFSGSATNTVFVNASVTATQLFAIEVSA